MRFENKLGIWTNHIDLFFIPVIISALKYFLDPSGPEMLIVMISVLFLKSIFPFLVLFPLRQDVKN